MFLLLLLLIGAAWASPFPVLLSTVPSLVFTNGLYTVPLRGVKPLPQLVCVGGNACHRVPSQIRCQNLGLGAAAAPSWLCTANLDNGVTLSNTDVVCQGYESKHDPFVYLPSCNLEYTLIHTPIVVIQHTPHGGVVVQSHSGAFDALLLVLFIVLILFCICYCTQPSYYHIPSPPRRRRPPYVPYANEYPTATYTVPPVVTSAAVGRTSRREEPTPLYTAPMPTVTVPTVVPSAAVGGSKRRDEPESTTSTAFGVTKRREPATVLSTTVGGSKRRDE
jgi:hypothetical protein